MGLPGSLTLPIQGMAGLETWTLGLPMRPVPVAAPPGVGDGGRPNSRFQNCRPQGLALIVQENSQKQILDDSARGGSITFSFESPADLRTVYILDIDEDRPVVLEVTVVGTGGLRKKSTM